MRGLEYEAVPLALMKSSPKEWRDQLKMRSVEGWELISTVKTPMGDMFLFNRPEQKTAGQVFPRDVVVEPSLGIIEALRMEEEAWRKTGRIDALKKTAPWPIVPIADAKK